MTTKWVLQYTVKMAIAWGVLSFSVGSLASVAFYTGSFDPPTKAHEAIIRSGVQSPGVEKLYVIVNVSGEKNFNISSYERISMLNKSLQDLGDKVEVLPVIQEAKTETMGVLSKGRPLKTMPVIAFQRAY